MKYVIDEYNNVALFSDNIPHVEVGSKMNGKAINAGFVTFIDDREIKLRHVIAFGESISLNLKSKEEDSHIISNFLRLTQK